MKKFLFISSILVSITSLNAGASQVGELLLTSGSADLTPDSITFKERASAGIAYCSICRNDSTECGCQSQDGPVGFILYGEGCLAGYSLDSGPGVDAGQLRGPADPTVTGHCSYSSDN